MAGELFSAAWAKAWRREINRSEEFRRTGGAWRGTLLLVADDDANARAVFLELENGSCRVARPATTADRTRAEIVFSASPRTWRELFAGRADLFLSVALGRFSMPRGELAELKAHLPAARALLAAAGRLGSP